MFLVDLVSCLGLLFDISGFRVGWVYAACGLWRIWWARLLCLDVWIVLCGSLWVVVCVVCGWCLGVLFWCLGISCFGVLGNL